MRREALLGTGLLLAAIGEIQWATAFFADPTTQVEAAFLFVAAAGLLLAAAGFYFPGAARGVLLIGLFAAALGHVAYFGYTLSWGWILSVAAGLASLGLILAAVAQRIGRPDLLRVGFAGASLAGLVWTLYDIYTTSYAFTVGNVFTTIGFATAAIFATTESANAA